MFTCVVKYKVKPEKNAEFREYARVWIILIQKYGGCHHGYFCPPTNLEKQQMPAANYSFPDIASEGPAMDGYALFSFDSRDAYEAYRMAVSEDELCKSTTEKFNKNSCFSSYERSFKTPILP
jgi:hypothetical protein